MSEKTMICMVGLPRSGKSTFVDKHYSNQFQIVCADDIRLGLGTQFDPRLENFVWGVHDTMIRAHLQRGYSVVIDSTNTVIDRISRYKAMADEKGYVFKVVLIDTPIEMCIFRNTGEGSVPDDTITRMAVQLEETKNDPKFRELEVIHVKK